MKSSNYKLSEIASNEMMDYALYTIANRAIPNMHDGLKPVQRFYLYSSIVNTPRDFKKVSAVAGVVSDYGYQHGETSAMDAGQLMAATWNNNVCLIQGRGSFGTRQIQDAGAPRYTYTKVHANFNKYIKDVNLAPSHIDPEHIPPQFYLPVLPLVLANGIKGIATGFATNILPRSIDDLKDACAEYLATGEIKKKLPVVFPDFKGTTVYDASIDRFVCEGIYQKSGTTKLTITEIPYGFDRESYIKILDKLEDAGDIFAYVDQCGKQGFQFEVKLKRNSSGKWTHNEILKNFRLTKNHSENLTVIDENDVLRIYTDERKLISDFCDYRVNVLQLRIDLKLNELTEQSRWLKIKVEFVNAVLNDKIVFKGKKKDHVTKQILAETAATVEDCDRLLRLNIMSLTKELVDAAKAEIKEAAVELRFWKKTTPSDQFTSDLQEL